MLDEAIVRALEAATHLDVEAGVRYWEDAAVNGTSDDDGTLIPGRDGETWKIRLRLMDGVVEAWPEGTTAEIHYKVCDDGAYWLSDASGKRLAKWSGSYVPNDFLCHGDEGFGDYIILKVGEDGRIESYKKSAIRADDWDLINPVVSCG